MCIIPWTEKPGGLQFMGSQRVRHNIVTEQLIQLTSLFFPLQQAFIFPLFLLQCLKPREIHFLFKFGCVYKYHVSRLSTLNAMVSWPVSALKSLSFVCLPRVPENTEYNNQSL